MKKQKNNQDWIDPVCGMRVTPETAAGQTDYHGTRIYFCAKACQAAFVAQPNRYQPKKSKGLWGRYLDRLNKTTGERPPSCCG